MNRRKLRSVGALPLPQFIHTRHALFETLRFLFSCATNQC
jgi:hypothetical protein